MYWVSKGTYIITGVEDLHTLERSRTFLITHLARVTPEWVSSMSPRSLVMVAA